MEKHPYSIRLDDVLDKRLQRIAAVTGRTKTSFIREAIEQYIEDMEDYADAIAAMKDKGSITLDALEKDLGLDKDVDDRI
jgi:RHH-type rel operon transcriptional repressor/antitoxin RelB